MQQLLIIFHVLISIGLVLLVLIQQGKGAEAGATFGSGASNTMFGSAGRTPFLVKITALLAAMFFATSLSIGYFVSGQSKHHRASHANHRIVMPIKQANIPSYPINQKGNTPKKGPTKSG